MMKFLPRSAIIILDSLARRGPMSPKDISSTTALPMRTVTFALQRLTEAKVCRKVPNLLDMRRPLYGVNREFMGEVKHEIELVKLEAAIRAKLF